MELGSDARGDQEGRDEPVQIRGARDFDATERLEMPVLYLDVEEHEAPRPQALDQARERDFGAVCLTVEHGLAREHAADRDPVYKTAFQRG